MARRRSQQQPKYVMISTVAERFGVHPQTLRLYEREGLIKPARSTGNTRLYDESAIRRVEAILTLTRDMGVNLAGVEVILVLREQLEELQREVHRLLASMERERGETWAGVHRRHALVKIDRGPLVAPQRTGGARR